jgi:hypothetical protein
MRVAGTIADLSERNNAKAAPHEVETRYHDIVGRSAQGIYQTGVDGRGLSVNMVSQNCSAIAMPRICFLLVTQPNCTSIRPNAQNSRAACLPRGSSSTSKSA